MNRSGRDFDEHRNHGWARYRSCNGDTNDVFQRLRERKKGTVLNLRNERDGSIADEIAVGISETCLETRARY